MKFKQVLHITIFLAITLGIHFGFKAMAWPGSIAALGFIPIIYAIIHLVKSIINVIKGRKRAFLNSLVIALLFLIIASKIIYYYYNLPLSILILVISAWVTRMAWKKDADENSKKNKVTLIALVCFNAILISVPDQRVLQYIQNPRAIHWQKLTFEDFEGPVIDTAHHDAETSTGINYKVNEAYNYPAAVLYAQMTPSRSWMRTFENENPSFHQLLLEHEQGHFDIVEFYKRKACDSISNEWGKPAQEMTTIIEYWIKELNSMHDIYDKSTNHGLDSLSQRNWTAFIQKALESNEVPNPNDLKKLALANKENGFSRKPVELITDADTTNWKTLTGTEGDYAIHYPDNWDRNYNTSGATAFIVASPRDSLGNSNVVISLSVDTVQDSNINAYANSIQEGTRNLYSNVKLLEYRKIIVDKNSYDLMITTLEKNNVTYLDERWINIVRGKAYVLHFFTTQKIFDKYRKTGEAILASFTLTK